MKIEVGKRYLYKRNVDMNGVNKTVEQIVEVKKICEHRAKVQIIGGKEKTVDIRFLHEFEVHFPKVESQDEPKPTEYPPGTKLTSNHLFTIDEPSKPAHYDTGIDTIAFMRANCSPEQLEGFLRGNALKYLQRYPKKNGVDDLRKAKHYVEMLIEELEGRA